MTLNYDDHASNPFLHEYHPDHDNLDVKFSNALPQGAESYTIQREIRLSVLPPADDFVSLTSVGDSITGEYAETIKLMGLARSGGAFDTRLAKAVTMEMNLARCSRRFSRAIPPLIDTLR